MNKFTLFTAVLLTGLTQAAVAQSGAVAGSLAGSESNSGASAGAAGFGFGGQGIGVGGGGGSASANASPTIVVGSGNVYEAPDLGDHVPTMFIPNLTTSNGTCMGSFSSGLTVSGFGGGIGKTYTSGECNARFNANQMNALGAKQVAFEIMCSLDSVYDADQRAGTMRCADRDAGTTEPTAAAESKTPVNTVEMKYWTRDPLTGAYQVIVQPDADLAMVTTSNFINQK